MEIPGKLTQCFLGCKCGGMVTELVDGIFYSITERKTIIFVGLCDSCGDKVAIEKDLISLLMLVPVKGVQ